MSERTPARPFGPRAATHSERAPSGAAPRGCRCRGARLVRAVRMNGSPEAAALLEPFTEDHEAFRRSVRAVVEAELTPHAREWDDAGAFPRELFRRFGELGWFGIRHPVAWGGSGLDAWY